MWRTLSLFGLVSLWPGLGSRDNLWPEAMRSIIGVGPENSIRAGLAM